MERRNTKKKETVEVAHGKHCCLLCTQKNKQELLFKKRDLLYLINCLSSNDGGATDEGIKQLLACLSGENDLARLGKLLQSLQCFQL